MKRTLILLLVIVMGLGALTGCGAATLSGRYNLAKMEVGGEDMTAMLELVGMKKEDMYMEFKADGTFTMEVNLMGESQGGSGTYKVEGNTLALTVEGETLNAKLEGNAVTMEMDGVVVTFQK